MLAADLFTHTLSSNAARYEIVRLRKSTLKNARFYAVCRKLQVKLSTKKGRELSTQPLLEIENFYQLGLGRCGVGELELA